MLLQIKKEKVLCEESWTGRRHGREKLFIYSTYD